MAWIQDVNASYVKIVGSKSPTWVDLYKTLKDFSIMMSFTIMIDPNGLIIYNHEIRHSMLIQERTDFFDSSFRHAIKLV